MVYEFQITQINFQEIIVKQLGKYFFSLKIFYDSFSFWASGVRLDSSNLNLDLKQQDKNFNR
jgi:hypothetical protein